ncbi:lambda-type exonuclease [Phaeocystis globosa virus PgV-16T]|uniref:Lambda-type exonuclease n=1 Tax=Phaeocystis globosa virus PgV-16T TaxID=3071227 RepID=A0AC59EWV9_9VIRU|nr:exonuclease [Phaeocystis globosa virus]AGM15440.1 lambda-type exonuclease [Phaeocystis globosa virus PgV-16T]
MAAIQKYGNYMKYVLNKYDVSSLDADLLLYITKMMLEYIDDNILQIIHTDLYDSMYDYTFEVLSGDYIDTNIFETMYKLSKEDSIKLLNDYINMGSTLVSKYVMPHRSYTRTYIRHVGIDVRKIDAKIKKLTDVIQPEQRTDEWYIFRNSTLTASNIWKVFGTEASQSQLILEKCEPMNINKFKVTNTNSPMHWGQKFEPVSNMYYEYINNTTVTEFGCIPHPEFSYIAASPDGIVCDRNSPLYGRMIEIKNVVSRVITGIPKKEYWVQMQLQMEVCDLNECDFLETKFLEYDTQEDYENDNEIEYKGVMLQYLKDEAPYYVYAPFMLTDLNSAEYKKWYEEQEIANKDMELIKTIYWKLVKISCVLVLRNKIWFKKIQPMVEVFWNKLVDERETGKYKLRLKNKCKYEIEDEKSRSDFPTPGCLVNMDLFKHENNILVNVALPDVEPVNVKQVKIEPVITKRALPKGKCLIQL